jgi:hypothetical protein
MAHSTAFPLAALAVCALNRVACCDIGFAQAAEIARSANPARPLCGIKQRVRGDERVFATSNINLVNTLTYTLDIDAVTGAIVGEELEEILPPEDLESAAVLARIPLVEIDFPDALVRANAALGRTDADVFRIDLESEFFMIFYQVRYNDGARMIVDAVSGRVIADKDDATVDNAIAVDLMQARIAAAQALAGAPWVVFEADAFVREDGFATTVLLLNPVNGRVRQVDALGPTSTMLTYTPIGRLADDVEALRAELATVVDTPSEFVAHVAETFPGALVATVALDTRVRDGAVRTRWSATLLTAAGESIEYSIDATTPIGRGVALVRLARARMAGDLDQDGAIGASDLGEVMQSFGEQYPPHDLDGDGVVGSRDVAWILQHWTAPAAP